MMMTAYAEQGQVARLLVKDSQHNARFSAVLPTRDDTAESLLGTADEVLRSANFGRFSEWMATPGTDRWSAVVQPKPTVDSLEAGLEAMMMENLHRDSADPWADELEESVITLITGVAVALAAGHNIYLLLRKAFDHTDGIMSDRPPSM